MNTAEYKICNNRIDALETFTTVSNVSSLPRYYLLTDNIVINEMPV